MYIHFDKDEWNWIKRTVEWETGNAEDFETRRMLVHIYDKMIEEEEWERNREAQANEDLER